MVNSNDLIANDSTLRLPDHFRLNWNSLMLFLRRWKNRSTKRKPQGSRAYINSQPPISRLPLSSNNSNNNCLLKLSGRKKKLN